MLQIKKMDHDALCKNRKMNIFCATGLLLDVLNSPTDGELKMVCIYHFIFLFLGNYHWVSTNL